MNRNQALKQVDNLMKTGFSMLTVRGLINKIYDSIEKQSFIPQQTIKTPQTSHIPSKGIIDVPVHNLLEDLSSLDSVSDKMKINYDESQMVKILKRTDIVAYTKLDHKYEIHSVSHGKMYYFPKADKVQLTKTNDWLSPGFDWLFKNI